MNELNIYDNDVLGSVRTVTIDGEPWFIALDVCQILGLRNVSQAVSKLDADEKGICNRYTLGGEQELLIVNEPGLYSLILTSRREEAKQFKHWITHEVLPSIRREGFYSTLTTETLIEVLTRKQREDSTYLDRIDKTAIKRSILNEDRAERMVKTRELWSKIESVEYLDFRKELRVIWKDDAPMLHKYLDKHEVDSNKLKKGKQIVMP